MHFVSRTSLERATIEGNSPVNENKIIWIELFSSRAGPEKSRLNLGALTSKAKYYMRSIVN